MNSTTPLPGNLRGLVLNSLLASIPPEAQHAYDEAQARLAERFPERKPLSLAPQASVPAASTSDEDDADSSGALATVEHFQNLIAVIRNDAASAQRDLTPREERRIESCQEAMAVLQEASDRNSLDSPIKARRTLPEPLNESDGGRQGRGVPSSGWKDKDGRPVRTLKPTDSLVATVHRPLMASGRPAPLPNVGQTIRGLVTGDWGDFDPRAALSEGTDTAGGYMVVPELSAQIIDLARASSVIHQAGAITVPMHTSELDMVSVARDPDVSWVKENMPIPETGVAFGRLAFRAKKMAAIVNISHELIEDAPNASTEIQRLLGIAMGQELDRVSIFGAGGAEPIGLLHADGVQSLTPTSPGHLSYDTLLDAIALVEALNGNPNAYILNSTSKRTLAGLKDTQANYLTPPADVAALAKYVTTKLPDDTAILGDFRQVMFGVRIGVQLEMSYTAGAAFENDQLKIRVRWRGDVQFAKPYHLVKITGITTV